ncbi:MAG: FimV/HubP family polar landmark protein [Burkholderiaceae bacterium]
MTNPASEPRARPADVSVMRARNPLDTGRLACLAGAVTLSISCAAPVDAQTLAAGPDQGRLELRDSAKGAYEMRLGDPKRISRPGEALRVLIPIQEASLDRYRRPSVSAKLVETLPPMSLGTDGPLEIDVIDAKDGRRSVRIQARDPGVTLTHMELALFWYGGTFRRSYVLQDDAAGASVRLASTREAASAPAATASAAATPAGDPAPAGGDAASTPPSDSGSSAPVVSTLAPGQASAPPAAGTTSRDSWEKLRARVKSSVRRRRADAAAAPTAAAATPATAQAKQERTAESPAPVATLSPRLAGDAGAEREPSAAPEAPVAPLAPGDVYVVQRGDTLWEIADRARPKGVSRVRAMVGIFEKNRAAFDGSIDRLVVGRKITLPSVDEFAAVDRTQAPALFVRYSALKENDKLAIGTGESGADLSETEKVAAWRAAMNELSARIKDLTGQISKLKLLIGLKDMEIARVEQEIARRDKPESR